MAAEMNVRDYDVTPERGYLTPYAMPKVTLPPIFGPVVKAGHDLPGILLSGRARRLLERVPEIDMAAQLPALSDAQRRLLMVHYSFIVQGYVWSDQEPPLMLPRNLAVPYCALSDAIGQFPLLPYSSYTLDNWGLHDETGPVSLDNTYVIQNFLGGVDENWFILVHVEIEAKAGRALAAIPALLTAAANKDMANVSDGLQTILAAWSMILPVFDRMPERCDPYIYYQRVRPYIHGWKGNPALPDGLIYEGVAKYKGAAQSFRGQTGSQSSIVPTMDALLGIGHENDPLREFLDELHQYRPPKHRKFIEDVAAASHVRRVVKESGDHRLVGLYNGIVGQVQAFRTRHLEYAANYINKQARGADGNPVDVGTGGTPFMKYLKKHRDESAAHLLPLP
jgi:indoleamine 2,3-dioxygenase